MQKAEQLGLQNEFLDVIERGESAVASMHGNA